MIDLAHDYNRCECGNPECDYDESLPLGEEQAIAEALVLQSPILRLVQERNEARELVKRMHAAVNVDSVGEEYYSAMLEAHRAIIAWKGGAK
jgi:hypothetical protein